MDNKNEKWKTFYDEMEEDKERDRIAFLKRIVKSGLFHINPDIDFYKFNKIYIDLDSILSLVIKEDLPASKYLKKEMSSYILDAFRDFFQFYDDTAQIYIIYNFKVNTPFNKIFEGWCKERYSRYTNKDIMSFIKNDFLKRLKKYSEAVQNVEILEAKDATVLTILRMMNMNEDNTKSLILSRDPHFACVLSYHNTSWYNGKNIINRDNYINEKEIPNVHYSLFPNYYLICGMKRNEYPGKLKFGPKKTVDYIQAHKPTIIDLSDFIYEDVIAYKDLFFINNIV